MEKIFYFNQRKNWNFVKILFVLGEFNNFLPKQSKQPTQIIKKTRKKNQDAALQVILEKLLAGQKTKKKSRRF